MMSNGVFATGATVAGFHLLQLQMSSKLYIFIYHFKFNFCPVMSSVYHSYPFLYLLRSQNTNSIKKSLSREAKRFQSRNPPHFRESKDLMSPSQAPATSEAVQSSPCSHPIYWTSILILSSHLLLGLSSGLFPSGLPTNTVRAPLLFPYVLHAPPISFFLIWSHNNIWLGAQIFNDVECILEVMKCASIAGHGPLRSKVLSIQWYLG